MSGQARGRHGLPDRIARQPDLDERPAGALAVRQLVAVDGDLGRLGAEPDAQAMPSLAPGQVLHGEGGPLGRLDRQALLGPAEDHADRLGARRAPGTSGRRRVADPGPRPGYRDTRSPVARIRPARAIRRSRTSPPPGCGGCARPPSGVRRRSRGRRSGPSACSRSPRSRPGRPGPLRHAGATPGPRPEAGRSGGRRDRRPGGWSTRSRTRAGPRPAGRAPDGAGTAGSPTKDRGPAPRRPRRRPAPGGAASRPLRGGTRSRPRPGPTVSPAIRPPSARTRVSDLAAAGGVAGSSAGAGTGAGRTIASRENPIRRKRGLMGLILRGMSPPRQASGRPKRGGDGMERPRTAWARWGWPTGPGLGPGTAGGRAGPFRGDLPPIRGSSRRPVRRSGGGGPCRYRRPRRGDRRD